MTNNKIWRISEAARFTALLAAIYSLFALVMWGPGVVWVVMLALGCAAYAVKALCWRVLAKRIMDELLNGGQS